MSKTTKRLLAFLMTICMTAALLTAGQTTAEAKVSGAITRGQVCQIVNKLIGATIKSDEMKKVTNYKRGDKYYNTMSVAYNAGYIVPTVKKELSDATVKANYNFAATVFSRLLNSPKSKVLGKHNPIAAMTLKDFTAFTTEVFPNIITSNQADTTLKGNTIINTPNITLSNVTVEGNLIIGDGVANQEAILDNVTVSGKLIVRGGGENSVKIIGSSNISTIDIKQVNYKVSIKVSNDANVQIIYINDGCNDVTLYGPIGTVKVTGDDIKVATNGATISKVVLTGENTSFTVSEDTVVKKVELDKAADNAQLAVKGTVSEVTTNAAASEIIVNGTGTVANITAGKSAAGTDIKVSDQAVVETISSNAKETKISGEGKVNKATLNGNDSVISTPETQVTIGKDADGVEVGSSVSVTPTPIVTVTPAPTSVPTNPGTTNPVPTSAPTPTPTQAPSDTINYKTDERFEAGYPQLDLGAKSGGSTNFTIKLQLKPGVASEQSPASVYYVITDKKIDASSTSVIHGHAGQDIIFENGSILHPNTFVDISGAVRITGNGTVEIPLTLSSSNVDRSIYFVIKAGGQISEVPTKIILTADTVTSVFDQVPPIIYTSYYSNPVTTEDGNWERTIRVYVFEELNPVTSVTGGAFTITDKADMKSVSGASITAVNIHSDPTKYLNTWLDLTLVTPADTDPDSLQISYIPPLTGGIYDLANTPNAMGYFTLSTLNNNYHNAKPRVSDLNVSHDGKYFRIDLSPNIPNGDYTVKINGKAYDIKLADTASIITEIKIHDPDATGILNSYDVEVTSKSGGKQYDIFGQEYDGISASVTSITDTSVTAESAVLNLNDKTLKLTLNTSCFYLPDACQFVLNIDGSSYRLRGQASIDYNMSAGNKTIYIYDAQELFDVDFSKITNTSSITFSLSSLTTVFPDILEISGKPITDLSVTVSVIQ